MTAPFKIRITDATVTFTSLPGPGTPFGDYSCQILEVSLEGDPQTVDGDATLCSPATTDYVSDIWSLNLTYYQDWGAPDSLSQFLFENRRTVVAYTVEGINVMGQGTVEAAGTVQLRPGPYGGKAGENLTGEVQLSCQEDPTFTFTAPTGTQASADVDEEVPAGV